MTILLWAAQILLAIVFMITGLLGSLLSLETLSHYASWVENAPSYLPRLIGISEILASFGLIVPTATGIKPQLTSIAAICLALIMLLAAGLHTMRGEFYYVLINLALLALACFVVYQRNKKRFFKKNSLS